MSRLLALSVFLSCILCGVALAASPPTYVGRWGGAGTSTGQFMNEHGVAVGAYGQVYVADYNNHRVQEFETLGSSFLGAWGTFGSDTSQFQLPFAIAVSKAGNVYVTDIGLNRVQEFTKDGIYVRQWGSSGTAPGQFQSPNGITIGPNGGIYISERIGNRIQEFDANGGFIRTVGSSGSGDGQYNVPLDVAAGLDGSLYVSDWLNDRIIRFDSTGTFVSNWDFSGLGSPNGMAIDHDGNVLVIDTSNHHVVVLDHTTGLLLTVFGSAGSGPGQFDSPEKIGVAPSGYIYVSDSATDFVSIFVPSSVDAGPPAPGGTGFAVEGSIPDPLTGAGEIRFDLPEPAPVTIDIYDVSGHLVRQVCRDAAEGAGTHEVPWNGRDDSDRRVAPGIYYAEVRSASFAGSKKVVVVE